MIFAMLAEKRFDAILATRQRAEDALRLAQFDDVVPFRKATTISDICEVIRQIDSPVEWFCNWRELFCASERGVLTNELLREIRNADSIIGWTVANVARRFRGTEWAVPELTQLLDAETNPTIRWRIAHVLGKIPTDAAVASLLTRVDTDENIDVRFGAIRSLVEISLAVAPELRNELGSRIEERAESIAAEERIAAELRSCLLVDPELAPRDWIAFVRTCVRSQFVISEKTSDKDVWRACLIAAEGLYGDRKDVPAEAAA